MEEEQTLDTFCRRRHFVDPLREGGPAGRLLYRVAAAAARVTLGPTSHLWFGLPAMRRAMQRIVAGERYDVIIFEYWYTRPCLGAAPPGALLAIDTHNVNFEKYGRTRRLAGDPLWRARRARYRRLELRWTAMCDLVIAISEDDGATFSSLIPGRRHLTVPMGQDLGPFLERPPGEGVGQELLFLGNLATENNRRALARLVNKILPLVRLRIPDAGLRIVGANAGSEVIALGGRPGVRLIGFAPDLPAALAGSAAMVLPLESGGGFRSRLVEVMAMGIPVVGTRQGLESLRPRHGVEVFMAESDAELAAFAARLLGDAEVRARMSAACRTFVRERYSLENTYGRLSAFLAGETAADAGRTIVGAAS